MPCDKETGNRLSYLALYSAQHKISPQVEHFPMSRVNEAMAHLQAGKARYRIVPDAV